MRVKSSNSIKAATLQKNEMQIKNSLPLNGKTIGGGGGITKQWINYLSTWTQLSTGITEKKKKEGQKW